MKFKSRAARASIAFAATLLAVPAMAADLNRGGWSSIKDTGYQPLPQVHRGAGAGPCYARGDIGVGFSGDTNGRTDIFDQATETFISEIDPNNPVEAGRNVNDTFVGSSFVSESSSNFFFGEIGYGCGSGSRGLRADVTVGFRGGRDVSFLPQPRTLTHTTTRFDNGGTIGVPTTEVEVFQDEWATTINSYSLLANFYYDFGNIRGFVPYVGAGVGVAYHDVDIYEPEASGGNQLFGDETIDVAWQVSAGVGYQLRENMILDVGYRYLDLGSANSGRIDAAGNVNPGVFYEDLTSHEIKVGLRYHFGTGSCCHAGPLK